MCTKDLIKSDLIAIGAKTNLIWIILYLLFSYNKRPLILIRLINGCGKYNFIFKYILRKKYFIEVGCKNIGPYLRLPHPRGIILSATEIGENCLIGQWVTIGGNNCKTKLIVKNNNSIIIDTPIIKNCVQIYSGSVVAGPIIIGNDVIIGANSTVTFDVENNSMLYSRPNISKHNVVVPGYKGPFNKL